MARRTWSTRRVAYATQTEYRQHNGSPDLSRECNQKRSHEWHGEAVAIKEAKLLRKLKRMLNVARTVQPLVGSSELKGEKR